MLLAIVGWCQAGLQPLFWFRWDFENDTSLLSLLARTKDVNSLVGTRYICNDTKWDHRANVGYKP